MSQPVGRPATARCLRIESLEDRTVPSWGGIPPATITVPTNFTSVTLNSNGDASGNAAISRNEIDWYRVSVPAGSATFSSTTPNSSLDTVLGVYRASGSRVAYNDDISYPSNTDSRTTVTLTAGTYFVGVTNYTGTRGGSYTWAIDAPATNSPPPPAAPVVSVAVASADRAEGSSGSTAFTFTLTRTGNTAAASTVTAKVSGSGASPANAADFGGSLPSGTYTFAAGQTNLTVTVNVVGDTTAESDEGFTLTLSNPTNATLGTASAVGVIRNDDAAPPTGGFAITVRVSGLTASQQAAFATAAARWESVITGDLPNATYNGVTVDDVLIDASGVAIDGAGGILGQAGPDRLRGGTLLPYHGVMEFDSADMAALEASGRLVDVIVHEMGHVLGIGTIWQQRGLLSGAGTSNPVFTGAQARAAYDAIFGTSATGVPVEAGGGSGTALGHWRESVFGNELMTGWLNNGSNPLSRVTAASLGDLGYQVNLGAADPYTPGGSGGFQGGGGTGGGAGLWAADDLDEVMLDTVPVVEGSGIRPDWQAADSGPVVNSIDDRPIRRSATPIVDETTRPVAMTAPTSTQWVTQTTAVADDLLLGVAVE